MASTNTANTIDSAATPGLGGSYDLVKKHPLKFTIDLLHNDDDPSDFEWYMFIVYNDYLQPDTQLSAEDAARYIDSLLPGNTANDPDKTAHLIPNNFQSGMSDEIFEYAKQIPHDHESQGKLIRLMCASTRLPITLMTKNHYLDQHVPFWRGHYWEHWSDSHRHACGDTQPDPRGPRDGKNRAQEYAEYINTHSFLTRLEAAKVMVPDFGHGMATACARDVGVLPADFAPEFRPCYIIAGAQWIEHTGELLWDEIRWGKVIDTPFKFAGQRYQFPPSLWAIWMKDFEQANTDDTEAKFWTDRAAKKMNDIMVAHGYTAEKMEDWDPEKQTIYDGIREDSRFAHLFKVPDKDGE